MYLHLGSDYMVKNSEIIAIFNLRRPEASLVETYVEPERQRYQVIDLAASPAERASCVLTSSKIYLSPISSSTLRKRLEEGFREDDVYYSFSERRGERV